MGVSSGLQRLAAALAALTSAVALLALSAASAGAATVTIGPDLATATASNTVKCENKLGCTVAQKSPGYKSPVTGTIVSWSVKDASGALTLRVLKGNKGGSALAAGTASGSGISTFAADVPIVAGERIGLDIPELDTVGSEETPATFSYWAPHLAEGETRAPKKEIAEAKLLFSAEVEPAPGITSVTPSTGPVEQVDPVTIAGHDFEEVSAVEFGAQIVGFDVISETEIVAEAFSFSQGTVPVTVTTRGGVATLPAAFAFGPPVVTPPPTIPVIPPIPPLELPPDTPFVPDALCHVPKLKGKKLPVAKRLLAAHHCKLGKVTKAPKLAAGQGKVTHQVPAAGASASAGSTVKLRLG